jgi:FMN reductase
MATKPFIVAIGGTTTPHSSTEQALRLALTAAERLGARVALFGSETLSSLPHYTTPGCMNGETAKTLVSAVRQADGLIIASPGYHGSISGLVKNALDYIEETAKDTRVYLDGLPVGLLATAYGWQAAGNTLSTLRTITHALRGWPTPLGAALNTSGGLFKNGQCQDPNVAAQIDLIGKQVFEFSQRHARHAHHADVAVAGNVPAHAHTA